MKKKIVVFAMLLAISLFWLPPDGNTVSAQQGRNNVSKHRTYGTWQPGKHKGWKHKKNTYGYKNYGQYRRTQVGNRRYRLVKRYYWNDGIRLSRLVRIYY